MTRLGLYLSAEPKCGGAYTYNRLILEAALELDIDVCAITEHQHWVKLFEQYNIRHKLVKMPASWSKLAGLFRRARLPISLYRALAGVGHPLAKIMKSMQASYWIFPSQDAWSYLIPVPSIGVIHDLMHRYEPQFEEVGAPKIVKARDFLYSHMVRYSKAIIVDSSVGKTHVQECYSALPHKIQILPFCALPKSNRLSKEDFFKKYLIPEKFVFYPAQFWRHKNHNRLIEAVKELVEDYPDFTLVLVGSKKNAYDEVRRKVVQLELEKHVLFLGFVDEEDLPSFYTYAQAMIMPTFFGPTNIPPLEAHLYDCPVVISGIYGMKEQLKDAALYIEPNSMASIKLGMEAVWTNNRIRENLIEKGRLLRTQYTQQSFNLRFNSIIKSILSTEWERASSTKAPFSV